MTDTETRLAGIREHQLNASIQIDHCRCSQTYTRPLIEDHVPWLLDQLDKHRRALEIAKGQFKDCEYTVQEIDRVLKGEE